MVEELLGALLEPFLADELAFAVGVDLADARARECVAVGVDGRAHGGIEGGDDAQDGVGCVRLELDHVVENVAGVLVDGEYDVAVPPRAHGHFLEVHV